MLTPIQYTTLWTIAAPHGFGQTHAMPSYEEYVIRENQYQDYLDIFRGRSTRLMRGLNGEHPYQKYLNPENPPCIKYIMIGEAAPPLNPAIDTNNDAENTYFYNPNHKGSTQYFSAPCCAFCVSNKLPKKEKLFKLAEKGVLLLDIFPFAVGYSTNLRKHFNNEKITDFFWQGAEDSIITRIENLKKEEILIDDFMISFITPPTISHHIITKNQNQPIQNIKQYRYDDYKGDNTKWKITFKGEEVPLYKSCTVIKPRSGPDCELIRTAFDLPNCG